MATGKQIGSVWPRSMVNLICFLRHVQREKLTTICCFKKIQFYFIINLAVGGLNEYFPSNAKNEGGAARPWSATSKSVSKSTQVDLNEVLTIPDFIFPGSIRFLERKIWLVSDVANRKWNHFAASGLCKSVGSLVRFKKQKSQVR